MRRSPAFLLAFLLLLGAAVAQQPQKPPLSIETLFAPAGITSRGPETPKWSPDGTRLTFVQRDASGQRGELWYIDVATGKSAVLVSGEKLAGLTPPTSSIKDPREQERRSRYGVAGYHWAPDSKHLLFDSNGQLWLFNLEAGAAVQLTTSTSAQGDPKFSPDGTRVSFVRDHDLWVTRVRGGGEERITEGASEELLNGEVDWVYAEELDVRSNYFWSPDSKQIAYLQMDESRVPEYPIVDWVPQHPPVDNMRYPKAGDPNPGVRVGVVGAGGGRTKWLKVTEETDVYIPRFGWIRPGLLYVMVLNRAQTRLDLYFVDTKSGRARKVLTEAQEDAWVEVGSILPSGTHNTGLQVLPAGDRFLWTSWRDGHTHIYLYRFDRNAPLSSEATLERQLTQGDFETFGIHGVDEKSGRVFYVSNQDDPRQRQVYSVGLDGSGAAKLTQPAGTHRPSFAPGATHFSDTYSSLTTLPVMSLCQVGGECREIWRAISNITYDPLPVQQLELKAADGETTLYGALMLPPNQPAGGKAPLILAPYGGPGAQSVADQWGGSGYLFQILMAQRGYATLTVDNRGMGARGRKFAAALRRQFGKVELEDQLAALKQVLAKYPQLDGERVGIWGWSYGGYMTAYAMTHSDVFKAGISGAPVTDWTFYDTIYTERYMGRPKENPDGYKQSSTLQSAGSLQGRLLLVHGTSDDNVHMQNTLNLVDALVKAGKPYDLQLYPRKTHGVTGSDARTHLYKRILEHFDTYLKGQGK